MNGDTGPPAYSFHQNSSYSLLRGVNRVDDRSPYSDNPSMISCFTDIPPSYASLTDKVDVKNETLEETGSIKN